MLSHDQIGELVRRAQAGAPDALSALARAFLRAAYALALARVGRPSDAEDVAQDAMLAALERIETCRDPERFGAWLAQIVRNRAINFVQARRLRDVPRDEPGEPAGPSWSSPDAGVQRAELLRALEVLSEVQREVVLLHDLDGWTHPEIAAALDLSEGMSRQHLFHARRAMRDALDPQRKP